MRAGVSRVGSVALEHFSHAFVYREPPPVGADGLVRDGQGIRDRVLLVGELAQFFAQASHSGHEAASRVVRDEVAEVGIPPGCAQEAGAVEGMKVRVLQLLPSTRCRAAKPQQRADSPHPDRPRKTETLLAQPHQRCGESAPGCRPAGDKPALGRQAPTTTSHGPPDGFRRSRDESRRTCCPDSGHPLGIRRFTRLMVNAR